MRAIEECVRRARENGSCIGVIRNIGQILSGRDILIEEGKIAGVGRGLKDESDDGPIDGRGKLAIS